MPVLGCNLPVASLMPRRMHFFCKQTVRLQAPLSSWTINCNVLQIGSVSSLMAGNQYPFELGSGTVPTNDSKLLYGQFRREAFQICLWGACSDSCCLYAADKSCRGVERKCFTAAESFNLALEVLMLSASLSKAWVCRTPDVDPFALKHQLRQGSDTRNGTMVADQRGESSGSRKEAAANQESGSRIDLHLIWHYRYLWFQT